MTYETLRRFESDRSAESGERAHMYAETRNGTRKLVQL